MKYKSVLALAVTVLSLESQAAQAGYPTVSSPGTVYRVIDGDTYIVNMNNPAQYRALYEAADSDPQRERYFNHQYRSIRVRLANADTPESEHADDRRNSLEGKEISALMTQLLEGQPTKLNCYDWGYYGRAICSLTFYNGVDVAEWLISQGYSPYVTRWGRHRYYDERYRQAEAQAVSR